MTTIWKFEIDGGNGTDLAGEDSNGRRFEATTKRDGLSTNDNPAGLEEAPMRYRFLFAGLLVTFAACNTTNPTQLADVAVSFTRGTPGATAALFDRSAAPATQALVLTSVEIVLREIELRRSDTSDCDLLGENDDGCEKVEVGPVLVSVPVDGSGSQEFSIRIPEGSYDQIEFDIHKVSSSDPADAQFLVDNPDYRDLSIRVVGTFDGLPFVFETDLDVEQELDFFPALQIDASTNITIEVGLDSWFLDANGQTVNPETGNKDGANENLIKDNIKNSIEAFEDNDRDGNRGS